MPINVKDLTWKILRIPLLFVCLPFYERQYLKGRWFDQCDTGWRWAIRGIFSQKLMGKNRRIPWPVSSRMYTDRNIKFDPDDLNNFQSPGAYFQCFSAIIIIGKGTMIGPNVGIITANHDFLQPRKYQPGKDIIIGQNCWIGMNAVLLPGIQLGNNTIVGAGAVVTHSFLDGNIVIAGNPAKIIRYL